MTHLKADAEIASYKGPRIDVSGLFLGPDATIGEAIACIDRSGRVSIALVVDDERRILNTISDGDVRRGLLKGLTLSDSVATLVAIKSGTPHPLPVVAPEGVSRETLLELAKARAVRQIPIVTNEGRVVDIVTLEELLPQQPRGMQAVVMAGGFGTRLRPLTDNTPKPMLPVGGRPVMELLIHQLRETGISKINITTHYHADKIERHFGDGSAFGVDISYVNEETPLGTGGALGLLERPEDTLLVINGDIITDIDFRTMHCYHAQHRALMTVAVRRFEFQVPYGVVDCDEGSMIRGLREKPQLGFFVNAGIYMLEPKVYQHIRSNQPMNMTDLIEKLIKENETVVSFPVREYWLDIGQHADYERAQADAESGRWRWTGPVD